MGTSGKGRPYQTPQSVTDGHLGWWCASRVVLLHPMWIKSVKVLWDMARAVTRLGALTICQKQPLMNFCQTSTDDRFLKLGSDLWGLTVLTLNQIQLQKALACVTVMELNLYKVLLQNSTAILVLGPHLSTKVCVCTMIGSLQKPLWNCNQI